MGISMKELNEKIMRCPTMNGAKCLGQRCMLWRWENGGNPHHTYTSLDETLSGEWVKDRKIPEIDIEGVVRQQRWERPATGYCGLSAMANTNCREFL